MGASYERTFCFRPLAFDSFETFLRSCSRVNNFLVWFEYTANFLAYRLD
jgi:hypothetical protein